MSHECRHTDTFVGERERKREREREREREFSVSVERDWQPMLFDDDVFLVFVPMKY